MRGVALLPCVVALSLGCEEPEPNAGPGIPSSDEPSTLTLLTLGASAPHVTRAVNLYTMHLVFLPLFHGYHAGAGGENGMPEGVEGRLVRRVEALPDGATWRYHLRTDVRWHDGVPVTARDIAFTFGLYGPHAWAHLDADRARVTVEDDSTFTITFRYRAEPFDTYTTFLPSHLLEGLDPAAIDEWDFWDHPVGNGPYRFVREEKDAFVVLEANPDHYRGAPRIERVILRSTGGSSEMACLVLEAAHADAANWNVGEGSNMWRQAADDPDYAVYHAPFADVRSIVWNMRSPLFQDLRVRQALVRAVDRVELREFLHQPDDFPLHDGPITESLLRAGEIVPAPPHLPDSARALLDAAGWVDADGDGVRERDGLKFRFELISRGAPAPVHLVVREQLRRVGVRMELAPLALPSFDERVLSGDFDATGAPLQPAHFAHDGPYAPAGRRCCTNNGYHDPEVVGLDSLLRSRVLPPEDSVYRRFGEIIRRDRPALSLFHGMRELLAHRRVRGLDGERIYIGSHMDELWIEDTP
jgi:peptide/nickel transport system substrate-binding protein